MISPRSGTARCHCQRHRSFLEIDFLAAADVTVVRRPRCPGFLIKLLDHMAAGKPRIVVFEDRPRCSDTAQCPVVVPDHDWQALGHGMPGSGKTQPWLLVGGRQRSLDGLDEHLAWLNPGGEKNRKCHHEPPSRSAYVAQRDTTRVGIGVSLRPTPLSHHNPR